MPQIDEWLLRALEFGASDIHIIAGSPPRFRKAGELVPVGDFPISDQKSREMVMEILDPDQRNRLQNNEEVDFAYKMGKAGRRFRCNAFTQRLGNDAVFHIIPDIMPDLVDLGLPDIVELFMQLNQGLVLVAGPRGCGKSSTQAAMIDYINRHRHRHIITVEDPIEFIHENKKALINQREVGLHTKTFSGALKQALRADPDIILVGEMRDLETISMAITAAETGHLVLGTLHTINATQTIDRIIDIFPGTQKLQIRMMVSESLRGVICQDLIPSVDGNSLVLAFEILVGTGAIGNLIRDGKTYQIPSHIQMNRDKGMILMDDCLANLVQRGKISREEALFRVRDKRKFNQMLQSTHRLPTARRPGRRDASHR